MHDQAGVRPSSGAATRACQKALENQYVSVPSGVAAPGGGRAPLSPILRPWQYTHPDPAGWARHLPAHLDWLVAGVESGHLRASGDTRRSPIRSALLVVAATHHESAAAFIATDPFVTQGLVGEMTITEWNPVFGAFNSDSDLPGKTAREVAAVSSARLQQT